MTQQTSLAAALGTLADRRAFFVYRLHSYDQKTGKWKKEPLGGKDDHPARLYALGQMLTFEEAVTHAESSTQHMLAGESRAVGMWVAQGSGVWFLDVDSVTGMERGYGFEAWQWAAQTGCFFEYSSSGTGVHLLGLGNLPEPEKLRNKWTAIDGTGLELYDRGRGICFGLTGIAYGRADMPCLPPQWGMVERVDGKNAHVDMGDGPVPGFVGLTDDEIVVMLTTDQTPIKDSGFARVFAEGTTSTLTVAQLWNGDRDAISARWIDARAKDGRCSEADLSLANIIAKHVGGDMDRVARLMWRSGLVRDVWHTNKGKVTRSARKAAQSVWNRLAAPAPAPIAAVVAELPPLPVITLELPVIDEMRGIEAARRAINNAGNSDELKAACTQVMHIEDWDIQDLASLAAWVKARSAQIGAAWNIAVCRQALSVASTDAAGCTGGPDWLANWVFEGSSGRFYEKSASLFYPTVDAAKRMMMGMGGIPRGPNGKPMNPIELFDDSEAWNGTRVMVMQYAPDMPDLFEMDGVTHANTYRPESVPASEPVIEADINLIWTHIMRLCKGREDVAREFVTWCAWQVQRPGQLVRWAPLVIGRQGIGKGFLGEMMEAVCGVVNCSIVQPSDITNSGNFTDWAYGRALTILDEVHVNGLEKYAVYNTMKPYITNKRVSINRKGSIRLVIRNTTNYMGFSNFDDAVPLDEDDRRWLVIRAANLRLENGVEGHVEYMGKLYEVIEQRPGALRGWLESWPIPANWPGSPMMTEDKSAMIADGENYVTVAVRRHTRNGVFNLTDSYQQIKGEAMVDGDKVPSKEALAKAAKQNLGMSLMRAKIKVAGPSGGLNSEAEKKLYVDEKVVLFTPTAHDAWLRWAT